MTETIDPITFEVVSNALSTTADEMALTIMRSAYSQVVRDTMDYSTALCDRNGAVIAQGLTLAVQLGAFPDAMRNLMQQFGDAMHPGDVFIFNDPYGAGGQHLPDIYVVRPIFAGPTLFAWAATIAHHVDVGGLVPGSNSLAAAASMVPVTTPGGNPVTDVPGLSPRLPVILVGPVFVMPAPARTAKLPAVPRGTDAAAAAALRPLPGRRPGKRTGRARSPCGLARSRDGRHVARHRGRNGDTRRAGFGPRCRARAAATGHRHEPYRARCAAT